MSQEFFDPELFADFIAEAKEHLETIEPNLLELEKAPDNLALLNDIFRPMDSLQGASGFLIENGELTVPVAEITIAGHMLEAYKRLTPANDLEFKYATNVPTLRVDGLTVAGN